MGGGDRRASNTGKKVSIDMSSEKVEISFGKVVENGMKHATKRMSLFSLSGLMEKPTKVEARLVDKDGSYHVEHVNAPNGFLKRFRDSFHWLLMMKWRWIILGSVVFFPLTWTIFAVIYYGIASANGDFVPQTRPINNTTDGNNSTTAVIDNDSQRQKCLQNAYGFADILMFSIETQTTVGYGFRYPNTDCSWMVIVICIQLVAGAVLQGCICGIVWARLVRPKRRGQEVVFSTNAVIHQNKAGRLCLAVRISDIAGNHLNNLATRMYFVEKKRMWNSEEETFAFRLIHMSVGQETGSNSMLLLWPSLVTHVIDESSPLYGYSRTDMDRADFEIIAVVEGSVEATGLTAQTRTSYLPHEIMWGRKFQPMNFVGRYRKSKVKVHYEEFDSTCHVETPFVSAKKLDELFGRRSVS